MTIQKIINKLYRYRKYNQNAYDDGYNYLKMFIFNIHEMIFTSKTIF